MNALAQEIAALIAQEGPITLERYMELCLQHPRYGYYLARDPFGAGGDFVTAPEISQMFGELIGLWMTEAFALAGRPRAARLVELGPGRGTLMADALRAARVAPEFLSAIEVDLVETSPRLRERQRQALANAAPKVSWRDSFAEVPRGPLFVVANEFFDALPARHFVRTPQGWRERLIGLDAAGALRFGLAPEIEVALHVEAEEGSIIEVNAAAQRLLTEIAGRVARDGGVMLVIDYGYTETSLGESLQAVAKHAYVDPLESPGEADLTTHVDFAALSRAARAAGAKVFGPTTQGEFLSQLGIARRAETLSRRATPQQRAEIDAALRRLIGTGDAREVMGELFKALAVAHPALPEPPGFGREG
ncbi:MAG TPA: SAM-dependent methyltransferase [Methylocystis sp.]|nr:SAM-dependent methyltransferase [Methylocystis sp.]